MSTLSQPMLGERGCMAVFEESFHRSLLSPQFFPLASPMAKYFHSSMKSVPLPFFFFL